MGSCKVCEKITKNKCSNCNITFYCSVEHQKQDWKTHKPNCYPFKVVTSDKLGRHLIATRDIKQFEIILKENPLIRGPSQITAPVCLGCLNAIDCDNHIECDKCGWLFCESECQKKEAIHEAECKLTQQRGRKVNITEFVTPHPLYQCITAIRCLQLNTSSKEKWEKLLELESLEDRRRGSVQWKVDLESIGKFIPKFYNTKNFNEDDIMKIVGILQINGHEVPTSDPPHVAIYYKASFLEHSCIPNLAKSFTKDNKIILWAPNEIKKNSNLSICYSDAIWGTNDRQEHLKQTKLFKCECIRCNDVTEFQTYYDAVKCTNTSCKEGVLIPNSLMEWNGNWKCIECQSTRDLDHIRDILKKPAEDLNAMEKTVDNYIKYLQQYSKSLPTKHFYMSEAKIQLVQQIGRNPKDLLILPEETLQMKIQYAKELINLYEILTPCETRLLGILCFELFSAIAENTRRVSLKTTLSTKHMLEESLLYVEKCVKYLQYEPDILIEGQILKQAKINRDALIMVLKM